jgi:hypothetical protein
MLLLRLVGMETLHILSVVLFLISSRIFGFQGECSFRAAAGPGKPRYLTDARRGAGGWRGLWAVPVHSTLLQASGGL